MKDKVIRVFVDGCIILGVLVLVIAIFLLVGTSVKVDCCDDVHCEYDCELLGYDNYYYNCEPFECLCLNGTYEKAYK